MNNLHTPGPWKWVQLEFSGYYHELHDQFGSVICDDGSAQGEYSAQIDVNGANARLIAAAPDLLGDLVEAAAILRKYEGYHRAKNTDESTAKAEVNATLAARFEATIAKARGEQC